jgi:transcription factor SPN1
MSDQEDDLFADSDSDDTADLIQTSKATKTAAVTKKRLQKKVPAAKKAPVESDSDDGKGLFDSDSEDDDDKKPAAKKAPPKVLTKKERLEALANRHRAKDAPAPSERRKKDKSDGGEKPDGYISGDSYDSTDIQRTKEDDDFLDTTGEDAEAVNELYADQHFDDERPDRDDEPKKKKRRHAADEGDEAVDGELDNPIMAAVHRMKKKKRQKKTFSEMEEEAKLFLGRMEIAWEEDEQSIVDRRPAVKKLAMLSDVLEMLTRRDIQRVLLDLDLLSVCKRWVQPLKNGTLGNLTVRQRLLAAIANMTGETGTTAADLKRSEFGKVVMSLAMHKSETPAMKRQLKSLIEQWSRPIFQKSGNMRDLERVHGSRGEGGLAALSRQQMHATKMTQAAKARSQGERQDIQSLITTGKKGGGESGITRVRVPFSKGFSYSVRPASQSTMENPADKRRGGPAKDNRGKLSKRMVEKGRVVSKNQRSANISVEGRPTKG